jgi:DNA-directed RNA polymerase subunit RPC12/RpoP
MVSGTDFWFDSGDPAPDEVFHEARLESHLGVQGFAKPPTGGKERDLPVIRFPKWYSCSNCWRLDTYQKISSQGNCAFCGSNRLVPSRFIAFCDSGHISDFPFKRWVHQGSEGPGAHELSLKNEGRSAGLSDIVISCSCGSSKNMQGALGKDALRPISKCLGERPWLPAPNSETCEKVARGSQRGSSGVWQASTSSSISIPPWSGQASRFVDRFWDVLEAMPSSSLEETITRLLVRFPLPGGVAEALAAVNNRKALVNGEPISELTMRRQEYSALQRTTPHGELDRDFVCQLPPDGEVIPSHLSRIHMISRLREVRALRGFTRLSSGDSVEIVESGLSGNHKYWLPAIEVSGEGLFIEFDVEQIREWEQNEKVLQRASLIAEKMERNAITSSLPPISARLLLIHTFAHAIIEQWSLECGYPASSLRERVYADDEMAGVLIYTATSDSHGSLGGIVGMAKGGRFIRSFTEALHRSSWCSNDPVCIENGPNGFANSNLGACHSCALISETSCELRNLLLDRGMLIGAPDGTPGFFSELTN